MMGQRMQGKQETYLNRSLRQMRKGRIIREEHRENKKRNENLCKDRIEKEREKEQKRIMEIRDKNEIWRYIKKERGRKEWQMRASRKNNGECTYFMNLLEGRGEKDRREEIRSKKKFGKKNERIIITTEELYRAKKILKRKEAAEEDELKNEV